MIDSRGIVEPCGHIQCAPNTAILYCSVLACTYIGSLYVFVPPMIRKLSRDHPTHIKYRSQACLLVSAVAILSYPSVFCSDDDTNSIRLDENGSSIGKHLFSVGRTMLMPPMGEKPFRDTFGVLLHTCILYIGPTVASLLYTHEFRKRSTRQNGTPPTLSELVGGRISCRLPKNEQQFWIALRNYFIAPWTEEIIFRGCMIQALLSTGMAAKKVALLAPLFFGVAHVHHAVKRLSQGERPTMVLLATTVQFLYTTAFGSYASHAFIRVGSVLPVTLSHSYCNWMGLPDLSCFGKHQHPLHRHRTVILVSYVLGIVGFAYLFRVDLLLPLPPELPMLILPTIPNHVRI